MKIRKRLGFGDFFYVFDFAILRCCEKAKAIESCELLLSKPRRDWRNQKKYSDNILIDFCVSLVHSQCTPPIIVWKINNQLYSCICYCLWLDVIFCFCFLWIVWYVHMYLYISVYSYIHLEILFCFWRSKYTTYPIISHRYKNIYKAKYNLKKSNIYYFSWFLFCFPFVIFNFYF